MIERTLPNMRIEDYETDVSDYPVKFFYVDNSRNAKAKPANGYQVKQRKRKAMRKNKQLSKKVTHV